jgi:hypothetical protein
MARDDLQVKIDEDGNVEPERLDTGRDLPDFRNLLATVLLAMSPRPRVLPSALLHPRCIRLSWRYSVGIVLIIIGHGPPAPCKNLGTV